MSSSIADGIAYGVMFDRKTFRRLEARAGEKDIGDLILEYVRRGLDEKRQRRGHGRST